LTIYIVVNVSYSRRLKRTGFDAGVASIPALYPSKRRFAAAPAKPSAAMILQRPSTGDDAKTPEAAQVDLFGDTTNRFPVGLKFTEGIGSIWSRCRGHARMTCPETRQQ